MSPEHKAGSRGAGIVCSVQTFSPDVLGWLGFVFFFSPYISLLDVKVFKPCYSLGVLFPPLLLRLLVNVSSILSAVGNCFADRGG